MVTFVTFFFLQIFFIYFFISSFRNIIFNGFCPFLTPHVFHLTGFLVRYKKIYLCSAQNFTIIIKHELCINFFFFFCSVSVREQYVSGLKEEVGTDWVSSCFFFLSIAWTCIFIGFRRISREVLIFASEK